MPQAQRFSPKELQTAKTAYDLYLALRPPPEDFRYMLRELHRHLPRPLIAALLDATPNRIDNWCRGTGQGGIPVRVQRVLFIVHQMVLNPAENSLFTLATWCRLKMPEFKPSKGSLASAILNLMYETPQIPAERLYALIRARLGPKYNDTAIANAVTKLFRDGKLCKIKAKPPYYALKPGTRKAMAAMRGDITHEEIALSAQNTACGVATRRVGRPRAGERPVSTPCLTDPTPATADASPSS